MSNKTQKNNAAKTALAPKRKYFLWSLLAIGYLVFVVFAVAFLPKKIVDSCSVILSSKQLSAGAKYRYAKTEPEYNCLYLEKVSSAKDRAKGLSGRQSMPQNHGMLFEFQESAKHCFWMKDTHFPLDIVWFDETKTIIHIEKNVKPDSFPKSFCPDSPALYVIEVNAGVAEQAYWREGAKVNF